MNNLAVLSGDLVDSSDMTSKDLKASIAALKTAARDISGWQVGHDVALAFSQQSGDGWQMALSDPRYDLRAALVMRAALRQLGKAHSTKIAVALGQGELPMSQVMIGTNDLHGPAYTASGRLLQTLGRHTLMAHASPGPRAAVFALADHISQGWTPAQSRSIYETLQPDTGPRAQIAQKLGISRPAVDQALWAAGYPALERALEALETTHRPD